MKLHFVAPARSKAGYLFGRETFPPLGFMSLAAGSCYGITLANENPDLEGSI